MNTIDFIKKITGHDEITIHQLMDDYGYKGESAEKDRDIAQLTEAFEINKTQLMELATIATDKEESIKELVEGLELLRKAIVIGTEYFYTVTKAKELIQKHKV